MSFDAGSITGSMTLNISEYTKGMLQAEGIARVFPSIVTEFIADPLLGLTEIFKEVFGFLKESMLGFIDEASQTGRSASQLGISVERMSELTKVAKRSGLGIDELTQSMGHLQRAAAQAVDGDSGAMQAFQKLGITVESLKSTNTDDLFLRVGEGINTMGSAMDRTNVSMTLFSRAGGQLIPLFRQGNEAIQGQIGMLRSYGAVMDAEGVAKAKAYSRAISELQIVWEEVKHTIGSAVVDGLKPTIDELLKWVRQHGPEIKEKAVEIGNMVRDAILEIGKKVQWLMGHMTLLGGLLKGGAIIVGMIELVKILQTASSMFMGLAMATDAATAAQTRYNSAASIMGRSGMYAAGGMLAGGTGIGSAVGGIAGGWAGAKGGAAIGAMIGGPWGAAIGGVVGGIAGSLGGGYLGSKVEQNITVNVDQPTVKDDKAARDLADQIVEAQQRAVKGGL